MATKDRHAAPDLKASGGSKPTSPSEDTAGEAAAPACDDIYWDGPPLPGTAAERRDYHMFHAVRLLEERLLGSMRKQASLRGGDPSRAGRPLGEWGPAPEVPLRLRPSTSVGHPATDLEDIVWRDLTGSDGRLRRVAQISNHFLRLYGATSPLPRWFAVLLRRLGESPAREFLDIFHHRLLSLLYRAWKRHHYEYAFRDGGQDELSRALLDLCGIDPNMDAVQLGMEPIRALRYLGLLLLRNRPAQGLLFILREELRLPLELRELPVRIVPLDPEQRAACPHVTSERSRGGRLGHDFVLGGSRADAMSGLRIDIGPVPYATYLRLRPGGEEHNRILSLLRLYMRQPIDLILRISVPAAEFNGLRLGYPRDGQALGQAALIGPPRSDPVVFCFESQMNLPTAATDSPLKTDKSRGAKDKHVSR